MRKLIQKLAQAVEGRVYVSGTQAYKEAVAAFNTAVKHEPPVVVKVKSPADIVATIKLARAYNLPVTVQSTGHGAVLPATQGVLINTQDLNQVEVDAKRGVARIAAGARWTDVVPKTTPHGLAPIAGSSSGVGCIGYMLGGGIGPLARSHGVSSDYIESIRLITAEGKDIEASASENPDLFWALRGGGRLGYGVITEMTMRLAKLSKVYGGSIFFDEDNIEKALRAWADWTETADPNASSSVSIINFPPFPQVPAPLRGRRLLSVRFAYPEDMVKGEKLAEPLMKMAPVYLGKFGELDITELDKIHNDPTTPGPTYLSGRLLHGIDQDLITRYLSYVGKGAKSPFLASSLRHFGGAMHSQPIYDGGRSAVGGRDTSFLLGFVGKSEDLYDSKLQAEEQKMYESMETWVHPQNNYNFMGTPRTEAELMGAWPADVAKRLLEVRDKYDPTGMFNFRVHEACDISDDDDDDNAAAASSSSSSSSSASGPGRAVARFGIFATDDAANQDKIPKAAAGEHVAKKQRR